MLANIQSFKIPITCITAINYLENLSERVNILSLYQKIFPEQWLESTIPIDKQSHPESAYSDREIEFINLVNENLFPVEYIDEIEFSSERDSILVLPQRVEWWNEDFEELEYSENFLLSLMGQGYSISQWKLNFGFTPDYIASAEEIYFEKLVKLCRRYKSPLQYLDIAIRIIDYSTENIWLDITCETSDWLEWTYENIIFLGQKWKEAVSMIEKSNELTHLLETSLPARKAAVRIWNQASKA
ncbi:hypothetical protein FNW02_05925 [Komarekiella sp. 'clone 1']|uniref:Uncharacterized protein n=1 Tax=Komarekiella delphini-convector SJRDD-AB1 TaxID=2593771 RepID=A0AA40SU95_9NOST|nr:hypothetical protein [Komarekiella delphini-convector]MBD6615393.1 hypothetical protein [Komarekiella delphini-convector SJRDD-AB1]